MFYKGDMQYPKQAMDFNWQLTILKERGLILENEEEALNFLHSSVQTNYIINYAVLHIWNAL